MRTEYSYDALGNLIGTQQGAQQRRFAYDSLGRLVRQKLAEQTATLNDNGDWVGATGAGASWSQAFWYDNRSNLVQKTDARGVKTIYTRSNDPLNRVHWLTYDASGPHDTAQPILGAAATQFFYAASGDKERVVQIKAHGVSTENYAYDAFGRIADYTLTLDNRSAYPLVTSYLYDTLSRTTQITYPAQYGLANNPRKTVQPTYQANTGRLTALSYNGAQQAGDFLYNAAGQATQMRVGTGANQITEEYSFDQQTGLLTNQKVKRANGSSLLDLTYNYSRGASNGSLNGKTGAVTGIINNLDRNKDRVYNYDALGRLTKAVGGINNTWTQAYAYDRYGNRQNVTSLGVEALRAPKNGQISSNMEEPVVNNLLSADSNRAAASLGMKAIAAASIVDVAAESETQDQPTMASQAAPPTAHELVATVNGLIDNSSDEPRAHGPSASSGVESDQPAKATQQPQFTVATDNTDAAAGAALAAPAAALLQTTVARTPFDFDADGKADISRWRAGTWTVNKSSNSTTVTQTLGAASEQIAPADYDGDGKTDYANWNPSTGNWTIKDSSTAATRTVQWGGSGDAIVPADYDGDGKADIAIWRPSDSYWAIKQSSNGQTRSVSWGSQLQGDIPEPGDYDGDKKADLVVWRPENGNWYIQQSSTGTNVVTQWGSPGDVPVPADYDGDGKTDAAVWRPDNGTWYIKQSSNGLTVSSQFGSQANGDVLVPADYDGDKRADIATWRPATGVWTIKQSTTGTDRTQTVGQSGDVQAPSAYIRRSSGPKQQNKQVQRDGHTGLTYSAATNRITNTGFEYDVCGNLTKALSPDGTTWYRYEYDAANRLVNVWNDAKTYIHQHNDYGADNRRLDTWSHASLEITVYAWDAGGQQIGEYKTQTWANTAAAVTWAKSSVYLGSRLLSTVSLSSAQASGELVEYHHADRLGTRLTTNPQNATSAEQATLPFGTMLWSETTKATSQPFTSYERSQTTGLDYAMNRTYDSGQGRFTQVDPIGMAASNLGSPQSLNMYNYVENDPVNLVDPSGLNAMAPGGSSGCSAEYSYSDCGGNNMFWGTDGGGGGGGGGGGSYSFGDSYAYNWHRFEGAPDSVVRGVLDYEERISNSQAGYGFITNAEYAIHNVEFLIRYGYNENGDLWTNFVLNGNGGTGDVGRFAREMQRRTASHGTATLLFGGLAVAVGTGAGAGMYLSGATVGEGVTTLGLNKTMSHVSYFTKVANQLAKRGWSRDLINKTVNNPYTTRAAFNRATGNAATAYFTREGFYVVRDNVTGLIQQISNRLDPKWIPDATIINPSTLR